MVTDSVKICDGFQRLCFHAGKSSRIIPFESKFVLIFGKSDLDINYSECLINYNGYVYCCTVPTKDGVIYVRRNKKAVWCGNSRSAQKGTVGLIVPSEDMPFSENTGMIPDIIINPNCIPSRMTINQLIECVMGKVCALSGKFGDSTAFSLDSVNIAEKVCDKLESLGMEKHGWENMRNGTTGELLKAKIFMGPTYYQRLKHLVSAKLHARARGPVTMFDRQPVAGRSRDGGLRFGEMERDCVTSQGLSSFMQERLYKVSDPFSIPICSNKDCGVVSNNITECDVCGNDQIVMTIIPYASRLVLQELNALSLKTIITPKI